MKKTAVKTLGRKERIKRTNEPEVERLSNLNRKLKRMKERNTKRTEEEVR